MLKKMTSLLLMTAFILTLGVSISPQTSSQEMMTKEMQRVVGGGSSVASCFAAGLVFGFALGTGNIFAAAGSGIYLATNCLD